MKNITAIANSIPDATLVGFYNENGELRLWRRPIVAWRIEPGHGYPFKFPCGEPVGLYDQPSIVTCAQAVVIDGTFYFSNGSECDNIEDALEIAGREIEVVGHEIDQQAEARRHQPALAEQF